MPLRCLSLPCGCQERSFLVRRRPARRCLVNLESARETSRSLVPATSAKLRAAPLDRPRPVGTARSRAASHGNRHRRPLWPVQDPPHRRRGRPSPGTRQSNSSDDAARRTAAGERHGATFGRSWTSWPAVGARGIIPQDAKLPSSLPVWQLIKTTLQPKGMRVLAIRLVPCRYSEPNIQPFDRNASRKTLALLYQECHNKIHSYHRLLLQAYIPHIRRDFPQTDRARTQTRGLDHLAT